MKKKSAIGKTDICTIGQSLQIDHLYECVRDLDKTRLK